MTANGMALPFTLILVLAPLAYAGSTAKDDGVAEARAAIEEANGEFSKAFERGDPRRSLACTRRTRLRFRRIAR
jgi:hypothetical protein